MVNKNPDLFQSPGLNRLKPLDPLQKMVFKWDPGTPKSKVTKLLAASLAWLSSSFKVAFFAPPVWQSILYLFIAAKAHHNPQILILKKLIWAMDYTEVYLETKWCSEVMQKRVLLLLKPSSDPLILFWTRDGELHSDRTETNRAPWVQP